MNLKSIKQEPKELKNLNTKNIKQLKKTFYKKLHTLTKKLKFYKNKTYYQKKNKKIQNYNNNTKKNNKINNQILNNKLPFFYLLKGKPEDNITKDPLTTVVLVEEVLEDSNLPKVSTVPQTKEQILEFLNLYLLKIDQMNKDYKICVTKFPNKLN